MEIENILKFAAIVNDVNAYFSEITPVKDVYRDVDDPRRSFDPIITISDEKGDVKNLPCPIDVATFVNAYNEFVNELNSIIIDYDNEFVIGLLECHFGAGCYLPTHRQLFKQGLQNESVLLSEYNKIKCLFDRLSRFKIDEYRESICRDIKINSNEITTKSIHFSRSFSEAEQKELFAGLIKGEFLPKDTNFWHFCHVFGGTVIPDNEMPFKPLKWIKTNGRTHGKNPSKSSFIDFLCLLGLPDNEIKNRALLNTIFVFLNNKPLIAANYTDHTDGDGNLKRPIISEYHKELLLITTIKLMK